MGPESQRAFKWSSLYKLRAHSGGPRDKRQRYYTRAHKACARVRLHERAHGARQGAHTVSALALLPATRPEHIASPRGRSDRCAQRNGRACARNRNATVGLSFAVGVARVGCRSCRCCTLSDVATLIDSLGGLCTAASRMRGAHARSVCVQARARACELISSKAAKG